MPFLPLTSDTAVIFPVWAISGQNRTDGRASASEADREGAEGEEDDIVTNGLFAFLSLSLRPRSSRFKFGIRFVIPLAVTGVTDEIGGSVGRRRKIRWIPRDCENQVVRSLCPAIASFLHFLPRYRGLLVGVDPRRAGRRGWMMGSGLGTGGSASFILLDLVIGVEFSLRRRGVRPSATKLMK